MKAILKYKQPDTVKELRLFLPIVNFYRRLLKNVVTIHSPLNDLIKGSTRNDKRLIIWTPETNHVFEKAKHNLAEATLLVHYKPGNPLTLTTDAFDVAVGFCLEQL